MAAQGLGQASIEAFGHAVGLGAVRPGELVTGAVGLAGLVERVCAAASAGRVVAPAPAGVAETVGELRSVVGEDGVDRMSEGLEEALQAGGDGFSPAILDDLDVNETGGSFDGHEDIGAPPLQARQVLEVDVDIAKGRGREGSRRRLWSLGPLRHAPTLEAAMQPRAGNVGPHAAAHHFQRIVQRQAQPHPQVHRDFFLLQGEAGSQGVRRA